MSDSRDAERPSMYLTTACWPVFEFVTNFTRQIKYGASPPPEQVRYEALAALRDAEDLARNEAYTERLWEDRVKAMMCYFIDYKMINSAWDGSEYWSHQPFETDPQILNHAQATGGEDFFRECDEIQKEHDLAERRERKDRYELAELLGLYFTCLRLGFRGQFHDRPQELADYTRRLFTRLPAFASTRAKEMFPDTYEHNQEVKVNYNLGLSLTVVLMTFGLIIVLFFVSFYVAWRSAVRDIETRAVEWKASVDADSSTTQGG